MKPNGFSMLPAAWPMRVSTSRGCCSVHWPSTNWETETRLADCTIGQRAYWSRCAKVCRTPSNGPLPSLTASLPRLEKPFESRQKIQKARRQAVDHKRSISETSCVLFFHHGCVVTQSSHPT